MGFEEDFWITVAECAIKYNEAMFEHINANRGRFGIQDKVLTDKIDTAVHGLADLVDPFLKTSIRQTEERGSLNELDDCIKSITGFALGSIQSFTPTFVHMNALLCERDFNCDYNSLFQSGMVVSKLIDRLYLKLMGQSSFIPPLPIPRMVYIDTAIDVFYQTDVLFLFDTVRVIPEYRLGCAELGGQGMTDEGVLELMIKMMEITPVLAVEYGNITNVLARRPSYPPNHDWGVAVLGLLEADEELYSDGAFFNISGSEPFTKCMIAQAEKSEAFIEKLKKRIKEGF